MTSNNLDPNPLNELGKGILDAAVEEKLLAQGIVFAQTVHWQHGQYLRTSKRPILQCYADAIKSFAEVERNRVLYGGAK